MKISFVTTVKNEEQTIIPFLESLVQQTRLPDEVIIVDAMSTDKTLEKINNFLSSHPRPDRGSFKDSRLHGNDLAKLVTVLKKRGNRSVGRNTAIKKATGDIIVASDAGCTLDTHWIAKITQPFSDKTVQVVAGFYHPTGNSIFQKSLATYTSVMPDRVDTENFLPSSRSIAFRKSAWAQVNGYPEHLDTCEDLVFAKRLKQSGFVFVFVKNALVYWPQKKNIFAAAKQFFSYALGDGQAHYIRPQTPLLFFRYTIGIGLFVTELRTKSIFLLATCYILLATYIFWSIWKNYRYVNHWQALFYLPLLQFTADITVLSGMTIGMIQSVRE